MKRLFVDCDDTLVTWLDEFDMPIEGQNPYGGGAQRWRFNQGVVSAVERWVKESPGGAVVIWSGGGADYARAWRDRAFPSGPIGFASKDTRVPAPGDIVVDDQMIKTRARYLSVQQFVDREW